MPEEILTIPIEEEAKQSYLDYAMSVIIGRAIPDVRDGLKPVQRRILYGMYEIGLLPNKPYKKSARVVGHILSFYHPHGDQAVYDTLVRMAQPFTMRYPLVDGQGNFGSIDGDPPAAMRYTEARLTPLAVEMLEDIDKDTVDWQPNFDGSVEEPKVLPSKFPNLLCNGTTGIAVGLATSIPPHNLNEIAKALIALAENPELTVEEIVGKYIKAPDFPTGGIIENTREELIEIYKTGKGSIRLKAKIHVERQKGGKELIVITELPYQVNKSELIKRIAQLVRDKKIKNITDLRDESDKEGIRIVIEVSRYGEPEKIIQQLLKHTQLRKNFSVNMVVLIDGEPKQVGLKELLSQFIKHRLEVITKRTKYFLKKAEKRLHIVEGLIKAVRNIDRVIEIVRNSQTGEEAKGKLIGEFQLSPEQAQAVLDLKLQRLTSLETKALEEEAQKLRGQIEDYKNILLKHSRKIEIFKKELLELVQKYGDERRSFVEYIQGEFEKKDIPVA
ncbi:MAG: DNA gyrase subunit A, partial [Aquificaceae bacterium]